MENNLQGDKKQPSISLLMDDILIKYGLQEDPDTMYQKIKLGKKPNKSIVIFLAKDFIENKINEKTFADSLQKQFSLTKDSVEQIINDIKKTYIPSLKQILTIKNPAQEENNQQIRAPKKEKFIIEKKPSIEQKTGPDNYRESIE